MSSGDVPPFPPPEQTWHPLSLTQARAVWAVCAVIGAWAALSFFLPSWWPGGTVTIGGTEWQRTGVTNWLWAFPAWCALVAAVSAYELTQPARPRRADGTVSSATRGRIWTCLIMGALLILPAVRQGRANAVAAQAELRGAGGQVEVQVLEGNRTASVTMSLALARCAGRSLNVEWMGKRQRPPRQWSCNRVDTSRAVNQLEKAVR